MAARENSRARGFLSRKIDDDYEEQRISFKAQLSLSKESQRKRKLNYD
jgi:hypothetical protein